MIFATIDIVVGRYMRIVADSNTVDVASGLVQRIAAVLSRENYALCIEGMGMHSAVASPIPALSIYHFD